jgi:hypothetical protein
MVIIAFFLLLCKIVIINFIYLVVSDESLIGLSVTYSISLSAMFQYVVRQSAEVENLVSWIDLPHTHMHILSPHISSLTGQTLYPQK